MLLRQSVSLGFVLLIALVLAAVVPSSAQAGVVGLQWDSSRAVVDSPLALDIQWRWDGKSTFSIWDAYVNTPGLTYWALTLNVAGDDNGPLGINATLQGYDPTGTKPDYPTGGGSGGGGGSSTGLFTNKGQFSFDGATLASLLPGVIITDQKTLETVDGPYYLATLSVEKEAETGDYIIRMNVTLVPEPATLAVVGLPAAMLLLRRRRTH